ncbi:MAG: Uncharacterised protein [Methanobacteriota archaeon]|nr:MAG: Uncharacterised protein [Euryarchaeota archaeon]
MLSTVRSGFEVAMTSMVRFTVVVPSSTLTSTKFCPVSDGAKVRVQESGSDPD